MSGLGLGVMIGMLEGNGGTVEAIKRALNQTIETISIVDDRLVVGFASGILILQDDGQSCCENRYMTCDDDLPSFVGSKILDVELRSAPSVGEDPYMSHDVQFLVVKTTSGELVCETHNEHNGYYGGFYVTASFDAVPS